MPLSARHYLSVALLLALQACAPSVAPPPKPKPVATRPSLISEENVVKSKGVIPSTAPAIKIGLMLPLTGDSASMGQAMLDAATLALYDGYISAPSDTIRSRLILLPKDTGNSPGDITRATQQLVDQGAVLIIGPLFSQSVSAMSPIAKTKHIPAITFSNNKAIAEPGIYTFGFLPEQQVLRMAEFAYGKNIQRIAVMAPNDGYGQKVRDTLLDVYSKKGGTVGPSELYAPSQANIDAAVSRLMNTYKNSQGERRFQALYIADGGYNLKNILAALHKYEFDFSQIKLLGTGAWDDEELLKLPEMKGAWFPSAPPGPYRSFDRRFQAMYGYKPPRLASLAYDAIAMASDITLSSDGSFNPSSLLQPQGFTSPANGLFRLKPDGTSDRRLSIIEITPGGFSVIDHGLSSF